MVKDFAENFYQLVLFASATCALFSFEMRDGLKAKGLYSEFRFQLLNVSFYLFSFAFCVVYLR